MAAGLGGLMLACADSLVDGAAVRAGEDDASAGDGRAQGDGDRRPASHGLGDDADVLGAEVLQQRYHVRPEAAAAAAGVVVAEAERAVVKGDAGLEARE